MTRKLNTLNFACPIACAMALIVAAQTFAGFFHLSPIAFAYMSVAQDNSPISSNAFDEQDKQDEDLPERDEIRRSFQLAPNAHVQISGINGSVTIETSNTSQAEVYVVRSARSRSDLEQRKIIIEQTPSSLVVRGERENERRGQRDNAQVRHRITLKLPRQIALAVSGVNGRVGVGEIDGSVRLNGINGKVEVAQARGFAEVSGINGRVIMTMRQLGEQGIEVSGVNGAVELRFADDVNADLNVSGINGSVTPELPNVTVQGEMRRSSFRARIGAGGSPIKMSGINGAVRLSRAGS